MKRAPSMVMLGLWLAVGCSQDRPAPPPTSPFPNGEVLATELAATVAPGGAIETQGQREAFLDALAARARKRIRDARFRPEPVAPEELATFLPDLGGWVLGTDTHLSSHDHEGYRYTIAHRRYRTRAGLLDLDIVDTGCSPELLAAFAARRALGMAETDGPIQLRTSGAGPSLAWFDTEKHQRHLEILLGSRLLVRLTGPERMPRLRLEQAAARIDYPSLRKQVPRSGRV